MKPVKSTQTPANKRLGKNDREKEVLLGLIEYYLETGKPVGSNTLKETVFENLSSATLRNYFASLEEEGYLLQQHTSGGRIPTEKAFRFYADAYADRGIVEKTALTQIEQIKQLETREISSLIRKTVEELSRMTGTAAFISTPRFDKDFVIDIKVVPIDLSRALCVLVTDFGSIQPEIIQIEDKLSAFAAKRIEKYLHWRLTGQDKPEPLDPEEEALAQRIYNEVMVRFLVSYTHVVHEEVIRTGLSRLLQHPEFRDPTLLADSLALFENNASTRHLLRDAMSHGKLRWWIGEELLPFGAKSKQTSVLTMPYFIHTQPVGAFGLLGPTRIPYRKLMGVLNAMSQALSQCLTKNLYKFKITFRTPERFQYLLPETKLPQIEQRSVKMIENRKKK